MTAQDQTIITVVSGLPRSGTSLAMSMLEAGGCEPLVDNIRLPDEDNPNGYFEFERVKKLSEDPSWLQNAKGKSVKIISALLNKLPAEYHYKIIFMRRNMPEVLASQRQMLLRRGEPDNVISDEQIANVFNRHLQQVEVWLAKQSNIDVLYVDYGRLVNSPIELVPLINTFLGGWLDERNMIQVVDPNLYRQRGKQ